MSGHAADMAKATTWPRADKSCRCPLRARIAAERVRVGRHAGPAAV